MSWTAAERDSALRLIDLALAEDLGPGGSAAGDLTSRLTIPEGTPGSLAIAARQPGVLAGGPVLPLVAHAVDPHLSVVTHVADGTPLTAGVTVATITGPLRSLLVAERTMLNFVQRLSGVATLTRTFVEAIAGTGAAILDTRKTTPGYRMLEKYAVRTGGGVNHRIGLYDAVLIKDNHLAGLGAGGITRSVTQARSLAPAGCVIEVEVDTLGQLREALTTPCDRVLLDNMMVAELADAVALRNATAPRVKLEASGGVNLTTVRAIAETGVDFISVGALTHSATALDLGCDYG